MEYRRNHLIIAGIILLVLLAFTTIVFYSNKLAKKVPILSSTEITPLSTIPPPTILYLDGSIIHFYCMDTPACFSDIDLGEPIKTLNDPNHHPLSLRFATYDRDSMLYLHIAGSIWDYLVKINPQTKQIQFLELNAQSLSSQTGGSSTFLPAGLKMIHGKIVIGTAEGKIGIVQDDFSLKTIDLKESIRDFIETNDSKAVFISQLQSEETQVKVFLVDVNSGIVEERTINKPQEDGQIVTFDNRLQYLYWVSSENKTLHLFDISSQRDVRTAPISADDVYAYTTLIDARYQYNGIWYYSRRCPCEGPVTALIMNMSTLNSVINPEDLLKDEPTSDSTFLIAPFGDNFLIGTHSRVYVISLDGTILERHNLPKEWTDRNYYLLEYRK